VDISIINLSSKYPIINCLSDHDAQILKTKKNICKNKLPLEQRITLINMEKILTFQALLKKTQSLYIDNDPNHTFNSLLCTILNIFQASIPVLHNSMKDKYAWITQGIKISGKHRRSLCTVTKNSNDPKAKGIILNAVNS